MINSRRREERIAVTLPVRVWGMDANGKPFSQPTTTLDITRIGARLNLQCPLQQGDIIGIQHGNEKARYRVAWIGRANTARAGQVGVICLEPDKYIWGTPLHELKAAIQPPTTRAPISPSFVQPLPSSASAIKPTEAERRDSTRFPCAGGAEFKNVEGGFTTWGTVGDVSDTGCYIESNFPLPARTLLDIRINVRNVEIRSRGLVRSSHPNVGMGIEFIQMSPEDKHRLDTLLSHMTIVPGTTQPPAPSGPSTVPGPKDVVGQNLARLRTMQTLARELLANMHSGTIDPDRENLDELLKAVTQLRNDLVSLLDGQRRAAAEPIPPS